MEVRKACYISKSKIEPSHVVFRPTLQVVLQLPRPSPSPSHRRIENSRKVGTRDLKKIKENMKLNYSLKQGRRGVLEKNPIRGEGAGVFSGTIQ